MRPHCWKPVCTSVNQVRAEHSRAGRGLVSEWLGLTGPCAPTLHEYSRARALLPPKPQPKHHLPHDLGHYGSSLSLHFLIYKNR